MKQLAGVSLLDAIAANMNELMVLPSLCSQEHSSAAKADQSWLPLNSRDNQGPRLLRLHVPSAVSRSAHQTPSLMHGQNESGATQPVR